MLGKLLTPLSYLLGSAYLGWPCILSSFLLAPPPPSALSSSPEATCIGHSHHMQLDQGSGHERVASSPLSFWMALFYSCLPRLTYSFTQQIFVEHRLCVRWGVRPWAHSVSAITILTCMVGFSCGQCFSVARPALSIRCGQQCSWCRAGPQNVLQRIFPRRCHQVVLGLKLFNHNCFGYFRCLTSYSERTPPPQSGNSGEPRASEGAEEGGTSEDAGSFREDTQGCFLGDQRTTGDDTTLLKRTAPWEMALRWPNPGREKRWICWTIYSFLILAVSFFTELLFECGMISGSVFRVFQLNTRQIWKCTCICWRAFQPGATWPLPPGAFGQRLEMFCGERMGCVLASRPRMLLNILQCTGYPHDTEWSGPKYQ